MRKLFAGLLCILAGAFLVSCAGKGPDVPEPDVPEATVKVSFINEVEEADFWILPQNPEILKTTLWGTATVAKLGTGSGTELLLREPEEAGTYIFRAIDWHKMYYSANDVRITEGSSIRFVKLNDHETVLVVTGSDGKDSTEYEVFSARL